MRTSRCVFNTAAALHRVFVAPIERSSPHFLQQSSSIPLLRKSTTSKFFLLHHQQSRRYASKAEKGRLPRDDEIKAWSVYLVKEDGGLEDGTRNTYEILSSIDRKTQSLVVVSQGEEEGDVPICKIVDKKAMREAEKARALAARRSTITTKTIELNWAIGGNDLAHRMQRVKDFLEKGHRVEVVMAVKRKGKKATEEEARELTEKVRKAIGECEGARENRPMEGKLLGSATIYAEGKRKKEDVEQEAVESSPSAKQ